VAEKLGYVACRPSARLLADAGWSIGATLARRAFLLRRVISGDESLSFCHSFVNRGLTCEPVVADLESSSAIPSCEFSASATPFPHEFLPAPASAYTIRFNISERFCFFSNAIEHPVLTPANRSGYTSCELDKRALEVRAPLFEFHRGPRQNTPPADVCIGAVLEHEMQLTLYSLFFLSWSSSPL
jgi:hypothetical protein